MAIRTTMLVAATAALFQTAPLAQDQARTDLVDTAIGAGQFETLVAAVQAAGLVEALRDGELTVFAPTDEAFAKLGGDTLQSLLKPENKATLTRILTHHVVQGRIDARTAIGAGTATTLAGTELGIRIEDARLKVEGSTVISNDVFASNGVIHVIDTVLIPPPLEPVTPRDAAKKLIETAVERGAPRFNEGDTAACAELYDLTLFALIGLGDQLFDSDERKRLAQARSEAEGAEDSREASWILRRALDATYRLLDEAPQMAKPASRPRGALRRRDH